MKRMITYLLSFLWLTACGQDRFENVDVEKFKSIINEPNVIVVDVRSAEEYAEGHLAGALNIDQGQDDFIKKAQESLSKDKTIAIYCRSGRRSALAANRLAKEGYKCVNMKGGIIAWKSANQEIVNINCRIK